LRWYVNDLSVQGQFAQPADFISELSALARIRIKSQHIRERLLCSRSFSQRFATAEKSCAAIITAFAAREEKHLILSWLTSRGPFLDDDRLADPDDYFEFEGHDVTDQGLGEATRRIKAASAAGVFSFRNGSINFERDPLHVQHGLSEAPLGYIDVPNVWDIRTLQARAVAALMPVNSWHELINVCRMKYERLVIPDTVTESLVASTFYPYVAERTIELLRVLQEYMEDRGSDGAEGQGARKLRELHFVGEKAWFTDESDRNKQDFYAEMSFADPDNPGRKIFCSWHGKIKSPQFRIHFEWPVPRGQKLLKVLYIGPKITKR
jgi:hypothetical protein